MSDYLFMCVCVCACVCGVPVCTLSLAFPARGAHINTRGTNCGDICNWFHLNFTFSIWRLYPFIWFVCTQFVVGNFKSNRGGHKNGLKAISKMRFCKCNFCLFLQITKNRILRRTEQMQSHVGFGMKIKLKKNKIGTASTNRRVTLIVWSSSFTSFSFIRFLNGKNCWKVFRE